MKSSNFLKFIENARSIHGYKYEYLEYKNMRTPIKLSYNGVVFHQNPYKHLMGRCPEKNTPKITQDEFLNLSKSIWGNRFDYSKVIYNGALKNIILIDKNNNMEYIQRAKVHLEGSEPSKNSLEDFIFKAKDKYGEDYDYSLVNYKGNKKKVKIIYKKTGEVFEQTPSNHLYYRPENLKFRNTNSFIKDANIIHDYKFEYTKTIYVKAIQKVIISCPIHGDFDQTPNSHLGGNGCPNCNEYKGEKETAKCLNKLNIVYSRQHKFTGCRNVFELPFDFYIPSMRTIIEFDGRQHYQPMEFFGGQKAYETIKTNDKIKSDYCEENYINLIRIKYDQIEKIPEILYENLKVFMDIRSKGVS